MRMQKTLALAAAVVFAAACADNDDVDDTIPAEDLAPAPAPAPPVDAPLLTTQFEAAAGQTVTGSAELRRDGSAADSDLRLHVMLMGLAEGDHAWHIHEGACGSGGPIVVALSGAGAREGITDDLSADGSGHVEESVDLDADRVAMLTAGQAYSLNVHQGAGDNPGPAVACATLNLPSDFGAAAPGTGGN